MFSQLTDDRSATHLADCLPEISMFWANGQILRKRTAGTSFDSNGARRCTPQRNDGRKLTFGHATAIASPEHRFINVWGCEAHLHTTERTVTYP